MKLLLSAMSFSWAPDTLLPSLLLMLKWNGRHIRRDTAYMGIRDDIK